MQSGGNGVNGENVLNHVAAEPELELERVKAQILEVADQIVSAGAQKVPHAMKIPV